MNGKKKNENSYSRPPEAIALVLQKMQVIGDGTSTTKPDPVAQRAEEEFMRFLQEYQEPDEEEPHYQVEIQTMLRNLSNSLYVDFMHVRSFSEEQAQYHILSEEAMSSFFKITSLNVDPALRIAAQRFVRSNQQDRNFAPDDAAQEFWIHFYRLPTKLKLRELKASQIGKLTCLSGTVTRTSEVRPELLFGTFQCLDCQSKIHDVEQRFRYTEPIKCKNPVCQNTNRWQLDVDTSKFVDWQKIRLQENANEIPPGSLPRTLEVILRHDAVEKAKAGDRCIFNGVLIVVPDFSSLRTPGTVIQTYRESAKSKDVSEGEGVGGMKVLGVRELTYKMAFLASTVSQATEHSPINIREDEGGEDDLTSHWESLTAEEKQEIEVMANDPKLYDNLVKSVAPTIYGHEEVKKGILLMLFGGCHKITSEGINLRGDVNVCVVGDPSVAKSQFLKYVVGLVPRSVYTAGKASSAAGLTASVVKDAETGEFNIEAGALMLADNGICCIDEFDKMDLSDQVAIHEAMEQQTITIAKAGIHATLNARTSILAAANPIGGRYDRSKSMKANLAITPALMSRFDLMFVVLDKIDQVSDNLIAKYIVSVHQRKDTALNPPYSSERLARYIRFARKIRPQMKDQAKKNLVDEYVKLRLADQSRGKTAWRITVRQLESMIRLSEALARLHLQAKVQTSYVAEAARLLRQSIVDVQTEYVDIDTDRLPNDADEEQAAKPVDYEGGADDLQTQDLADAAPPAKRRKRGSDEEEDTEDHSVTQPTHQPPQPAKTSTKVKLSKDELNKITKILTVLLNKWATENPGSAAMKQRTLVQQYMTAIGNKITSEEDYSQKKNIARAIIDRCIKENIISDLTEQGRVEKDDRSLVLSLDYEVDEADLEALLM